MKFQREHYTDELIEEMKPLWVDHYREIAVYQDIPLDPDLNVYRNADVAGSLRIFTARQSSSLAGYQVFFIHPHPHYRSSVQAAQDILFLSIALRKGFSGYRFIAWCDEQLKADGIQVVWQRVKAAHDHSILLHRLGYEKHDITWSRRLN